MPSLLYCVRSFPSGRFLSCQGNREKPAIVTCELKENAEQIKNMYVQLDTYDNSNIRIQTVTKEDLISMCGNACLDINIMDTNTSITIFPDIEHYRKMLDRVILM